MGFYFAYVDDYGNSGGNLDDAQQPIFMLFSVIVPAENWAAIEAELWQITKSVAQECELPIRGFELHAREFFSVRHPKFKKLSMDARAEIARNIAEIIDYYGGAYAACYVKKSQIHEFLEDGRKETFGHLEKRYEVDAEREDAFRDIDKRIQKAVLPYVQCLAGLILDIDDALAEAKNLGAVILDKQEQFDAPHTMHVFTALRSGQTAHLQALIEQPLRGDGKHNILLQATDILGYLLGGDIKKHLFNANFHERHEPTIEMITSKLLFSNALMRPDDVRRAAITLDFAAALQKTPFALDELENLLNEYHKELEKEKDEEIPDGLEP